MLEMWLVLTAFFVLWLVCGICGILVLSLTYESLYLSIHPSPFLSSISIDSNPLTADSGCESMSEC